MVRTFATLASVAVAAALFQVSEAHSNMANPAPYWPQGFYNGNSPVGIVDSRVFKSKLPGYQGVAKLKEELGDGDLRDFISSRVKLDMAGATKECGKSLLTGAPYDLPAEFDFPWGHPGACAAYCDDTQFFKDSDCQGNKIGKVKIDQAKCAGAKRLQVMYLGVHVEDYQYYVNCVPLKGSGGSAPAPAPEEPNPAPAPQPNPAPAPQPNPAPAPVQPNPAPAPTPSKNNCVRRLRN